MATSCSPTTAAAGRGALRPGRRVARPCERGLARLQHGRAPRPRTSSAVSPQAADPMLMYFSSGTSGQPQMVLHDSEYAIAHLVTAKHWHNVDPDGLHFTIADTGLGQGGMGQVLRPVAYGGVRVHVRLRPLPSLRDPVAHRKVRHHHAVLPAHDVPHDDDRERRRLRSELRSSTPRRRGRPSTLTCSTSGRSTRASPSTRASARPRRR